MGALIGLIGLLALLAGLISLVRPLRFLRISTRKAGAAVAGVGLVLVIVGASLTPPDENERAAAPTTTATTEPESGTTSPQAAAGTTTSEATTSTPATTTTQATTTTTQATTTTASEIAFGPGQHLLGDDIQPGVYETIETDFGTFGCYWERLSGLGGTFDEIIANDNPEGHAIVAISESDEAFSSEGCGDWKELEARDVPLTEFGPGVWAVGEHIEPGRYQAEGEFCYWERLSGFSGEFGDIIANDNTSGSVRVDIAESDTGFNSSGCGTWAKTE